MRGKKVPGKLIKVPDGNILAARPTSDVLLLLIKTGPEKRNRNALFENGDKESGGERERDARVSLFRSPTFNSHCALIYIRPLQTIVTLGRIKALLEEAFSCICVYLFRRPIKRSNVSNGKFKRPTIYFSERDKSYSPVDKGKRR